MSFKAEVIADSINEFGHRITTFVATFPRIVLAEFNTHRMFSRNSASSRAIPFKKMVEAIEKNPFIPLKWMKDHSGMQGNDFLDPNEKFKFTKDEHGNLGILANHDSTLLEEYLSSMKLAVHQAKKLNTIGLTKQICNRLLEPYMWHTAICTATEFENFYALRAEGAAEIHIQRIAELMLYAQNESQPRHLKPGEWHLPYGDVLDIPLLIELTGAATQSEILKNQLKIATARCAGVSYTVVGDDGKAEDYSKLIARHDNRLVKPGHWSPMEHPARSMTYQEYIHHSRTFTLSRAQFEAYQKNNNPNSYSLWNDDGTTSGMYKITEYGWCGNMRGYIQYRKLFANENRSDERLIKA